LLLGLQGLDGGRLGLRGCLPRKTVTAMGLAGSLLPRLLLRLRRLAGSSLLLCGLDLLRLLRRLGSPRLRLLRRLGGGLLLGGLRLLRRLGGGRRRLLGRLLLGLRRLLGRRLLRMLAQMRIVISHNLTSES
jgi:hypothetical protein